MEQENLTMTVEEAATALNISRSLAYEAARDGRIPCLRIGKRLLISRLGLKKLLDQGGLVVTSPTVVAQE